MFCTPIICPLPLLPHLLLSVFALEVRHVCATRAPRVQANAPARSRIACMPCFLCLCLAAGKQFEMCARQRAAPAYWLQMPDVTYAELTWQRRMAV